jgi:hypothetical protein
MPPNIPKNRCFSHNRFWQSVLLAAWYTFGRKVAWEQKPKAHNTASLPTASRWPGYRFYLASVQLCPSAWQLKGSKGEKRCALPSKTQPWYWKEQNKYIFIRGNHSKAQFVVPYRNIPRSIKVIIVLFFSLRWINQFEDELFCVFYSMFPYAKFRLSARTIGMSYRTEIFTWNNYVVR